jgi:RNase H-like domain found in reverse transcriptase/Integrase zinc binding domain
VTGQELQQFVCAANWMRSVIPQFTSLIQPLSYAIEDVYKVAGSRTRRAASKVQLSDVTWGPHQSAAFNAVKLALHKAATLAHPDSNKRLCLFTDASDDHWSGILTQIPLNDGDADFINQHHESLSFLSGSFKRSSSRWSTPEKEAFAIVESVNRLDYLLLRPEGFWLYTDHKNLTYLYNPCATTPGISKHVAGKIERWSLKLSRFRYTVVYIPGEDNCWEDMMSRWGASDPDPAFDSPPFVRISALFTAPAAPDLDPDFEWPKASDTIAAQQDSLLAGEESHPFLTEAAAENAGLVPSKLADGAIWIPQSSVSLQLRICVIGHCGRAGHRGFQTTHDGIRQYFCWQSMRSDIATFCQTCMHCLSTIGGTRVPRPMGHALHAEKPNDFNSF